MKKLYFIITFTAFASLLHGQKDFAYKSKWLAGPSIGFNVPLRGLMQGYETDYLLKYSDKAFYFEPVSISYFFHRHWGVNVNFQFGFFDNNDREKSFLSFIDSKYGDNYYPTSSTSIYPDGSTLFRGFLGLVYRKEFGRFYTYPSLAVGITSFPTDFGGAVLKEKNTNNKYKLNYSSGDEYARGGEYFTVAPSISFGYKWKKRIWINANVRLMHYKPDIVFEKELTNMYTQKGEKELIYYNKDVYSLGMGVGFIFVLNRFRK